MSRKISYNKLFEFIEKVFKYERIPNDKVILFENRKIKSIKLFLPTFIKGNANVQAHHYDMVMTHFLTRENLVKDNVDYERKLDKFLGVDNYGKIEEFLGWLKEYSKTENTESIKKIYNKAKRTLK